MKQQGTDKKRFFIQIHSIVDVITNSSSELYIFDTGKAEQALREAMQVIIENGLFELSPVDPDEYVIPEGVDVNNLFIIDLEHSEQSDNIFDMLNKYFSEIELKYKDE